jgi:hypothetical protein
MLLLVNVEEKTKDMLLLGRMMHMGCISCWWKRPSGSQNGTSPSIEME